MARAKKAAPPVELGAIISGGSGGHVSKDYGYIAFGGRVKDEPDRYCTVFFTNPGNARHIAQKLTEWADAMDALKNDQSS